MTDSPDDLRAVYAAEIVRQTSVNGDHEPDWLAAERAWSLEYLDARTDRLAHPKRPAPANVAASPTGALPVPVDWAALFNAQREEREDWLVEDLWPRGRLISLTAPRKAGKSLLMLYLAACLAAGRDPWTGRQRPTVDVVYLDHEMTDDDLLERLEDMGFGAHDLDHLHYFLQPDMPMLDQPEGGKMLLDLLQAHQAKALIIDTFSRVVTTKDHTGHEVREFYRWSAQHVKALGISVGRLDHTGHAVTDRASGTSAKGADIDVGWVIHPRDDDALTLQHHGLTRVRWVPDTVDLVMTEEPLTFRRPAGRLWAAGTAECAQDLDRLGVPIEASANTAQTALRDANLGRRRRVVLHAVAFRRDRENAP